MGRSRKDRNGGDDGVFNIPIKSTNALGRIPLLSLTCPSRLGSRVIVGLVI